MKKKGDFGYVNLTVPAPGGLNQLSDKLVYAEVEGKRFTTTKKTLSYEHIPQITYFPEASLKLARIDLKTEGKRIAYLPGAGDKIPEALKMAGYEVDILSESSIMQANLGIYEAIVTGVRLYNTNPRVSMLEDRLLDYVKEGGTLLVQYNVRNGLQTTDIGPYPFTISNSRVTNENSKVTFLAREHPVLNYPNKITEADFDGWIQERGLYFLDNIDQHYTPVLSMNDPGEQPHNGSLIVTDFGKGRFVYTSLSFFRQLPAGVPGAYRLFINLITKTKRNNENETTGRGN